VLAAHEVPAPVIAQVIVPPGALAPVTPVTVAVKVTVPPNNGEEGALTTAIVGVALPTVTVCTAVVGNDE